MFSINKKTEIKFSFFYFLSFNRRVIESPKSNIAERTKKIYSNDGVKRRMGIAIRGAITKESGYVFLKKLISSEFLSVISLKK